MNNDYKRQLLAQVLSGNLNGLRAYQTKTQPHDLNIRWVLDNRSVGGSIEIIQKDGTLKQITSEEFEALPAGIGVWEIQDHSAGSPVPAPDEDYNY